jgi:hypothetical protein
MVKGDFPKNPQVIPGAIHRGFLLNGEVFQKVVEVVNVVPEDGCGVFQHRHLALDGMDECLVPVVCREGGEVRNQDGALGDEASGFGMWIAMGVVAVDGLLTFVNVGHGGTGVFDSGLDSREMDGFPIGEVGDGFSQGKPFFVGLGIVASGREVVDDSPDHEGRHTEGDGEVGAIHWWLCMNDSFRGGVLRRVGHGMAPAGK